MKPIPPSGIAVIDLRTPPDTKWPGLVIDAGFFDEAWQWLKK